MKKYEFKVKESRQEKPKPVASKRSYEFDKNDSVNEKLLIAFLALVVLDVVFYYLGLNTLYSVLRAVLGLTFVLFIPGYIATFAFFREGIDEIERIALSIGLSISLVVLTVMFSNLALKIPINFSSIVFEILAICGGFYLIIEVQESRIFDGVKIPGVKMPKRTIYIASAAAVIALIFLVDIFYPYLTAEPAAPVAPKLTLADLYNANMTVMRFYPQKGISENLMNVQIPETSVVVFDGKVALLSSSINETNLKPGASFHITYYWASINETDKDYSAKVDITDTQGNVLFNQDHKIADAYGRTNGLIDDFEGKLNWKSASSNNNSIKFKRVTDYARSGKSLNAIYHIENSTQNDWAFIYSGFPVEDWSKYENISFWVYNSNSSVITNKDGVFWIKIFEENGSIYRYSPTLRNGWNYISAPFDKFVLAPWTTDDGVFDLNQIKRIEIGFEDPKPEMSITFSLFFDDIQLTPESKQTDIAISPYPTSFWKKGDVIMEEYDVNVPDINTGTYLVRVGVFDLGKLLSVTSGSFIDGQNRAVIGLLNITE